MTTVPFFRAFRSCKESESSKEFFQLLIQSSKISPLSNTAYTPSINEVELQNPKGFSYINLRTPLTCTWSVFIF